jgi:malonyl-CoA decarboxylase
MAARPDPTTTLVDRRAELLADGRSPTDAEELDELTSSLRTALDSAAPTVRCVTLGDDPALLERLRRDEAVHPAGSAAEFERRFARDRRCVVLEHPELPGRALNVVFCALWHGLARDLAPVLDPRRPIDDPARADTAIFYSIWNVEPGLAGLPGGRQLLERTVELLSEELPGLRTFATLSPIPGLRRWTTDREDLPAIDAAGDDRPLLQAAARYLVERRQDGRPLDPVARFHLGNGARLVALDADADLSDDGVQRSFGVMANYRYAPEDRAANRAALERGEPALGDEVAELLAP